MNIRSIVPLHTIQTLFLVCSFSSLSCGEEGGRQRFNLGHVPTLELFVGQSPASPAQVSEISSGLLLPGEEDARAAIRIINTGDADLAIAEIMLTSEPTEVFRLAATSGIRDPLPPGPYTIVPQDAMAGLPSLVAQLVVRRPARGVSASATIVIRSNSVADGVAQPDLIFHFLLVVSPPRLAIVPETLDFGSIPVGESRQRSFTLGNTGGDLLLINQIALQGNAGFSVAIGPDTLDSSPDREPQILTSPFELRPGQQTNLPTQYAAPGPESATAELLLFSNDPVSLNGTRAILLANTGAAGSPTVALDAPEGAEGNATCRLLTAASSSQPLTYTWYWRIGDAEPFTTFGPTLTSERLHDCDRLQCWTEVTDGMTTMISNVAEQILPFGPDCEDDNICTDDACMQSGGCQHSDNVAPCSDDDLCNGSETCRDGQCAPGRPVDCTAVSGPCLLPSCNPATGLCDLPAADHIPCTTANPCASRSECVAGLCEVVATLDCSDVVDPCVEKTCNPSTGRCDLRRPNNASCDDGAACNGLETCQDGVCMSGEPIDCSWVANPCLMKSCNPATGSCDLPAPDSTPCDDQELCNGVEVCSAGSCRPGKPVDCTGVADGCFQTTCNPITGQCDLPKPDGTPCGTPGLCNGASTCADGVCQSGAAVDCTAVTNPCLEKLCNPSSGLCDLPKSDGTICDDFDGCTAASECRLGACVPTVALICDQPNDACVYATCSVETEECVNVPLAEGRLPGTGSLRFFRRDTVHDAMQFVGWTLDTTTQTYTAYVHQVKYDNSIVASMPILPNTRPDFIMDTSVGMLLMRREMRQVDNYEIPEVVIADYDGNVQHRHVLNVPAAPGSGWTAGIVRRIDGGFFATGDASDDRHAVPAIDDIWLVWMSPDGQVEAQRRIDLGGWEYGRGVAIHPDGGYLITAMVSVGSWANCCHYDFWLARVDDSGDIIWANDDLLPEVGTMRPWLIAVNDDLFVTAGTATAGQYVMGVNRSGGLEFLHWIARDGINASSPMALLPLVDGGFLVVGHRWNLGGTRTYWGYATRIDSAGTIMWSKDLSNPAFAPATVDNLRAGYFILTGLYDLTGSFIGNPGWLILDENGNVCPGTTPP